MPLIPFSNPELYLNGSSLTAYMVAYVSGIFVSFTPCIYPVIPVTVAFIATQSAGSRAKAFLLSLFYVLGTSFTYTLLGSVAALSGQLFGQIQANPWTYFIVANICVLMGLSMLDVFTLPLPQSFISGSARPRKGFVGAFALGAAVGLVLGPCTAPVLGALLSLVAAKQNLPFGMSLLFSFAFGMGTLLILLGSFTGLVASLPKAGGWMVSVQKIFGWGLIAMGEYFLIKAGQLMI
ncbi:MAG TPA: cytochrome c biogenesis protein CcdA [Deltaproteobacteria bacterium]|mgnify:FL=1|jgi:thiol:disulfide interchange protein DsbD|nr:cytochrome c biogenesis protein CcdA [Deltaproteobacteria bacterium]